MESKHENSYNLNDHKRTYFNAMINIEENIWNKYKIRRLNKEVKELHKVMLRVINDLNLIYQVKYVSIYLMIIVKNNWNNIVQELPKYFNSKSNNYKKNVLMISCIFISSNYEELNPPTYNDIIEIVYKQGFEMKEKIIRKHVHIMEKLIWKLIDYQIEMPSANSFLMQIIKHSGLPKKNIFKVSEISKKIINKSLSCEMISRYKQSIIAVASYCLSISTVFKSDVKKQKEYDNIILKYIEFPENQMNQLRRLIEKLNKD